MAKFLTIFKTNCLIVLNAFIKSAKNVEDIFIKFAFTSIFGTFAFFFINKHTGISDVDWFRIVNILICLGLIILALVKKEMPGVKYFFWYLMIISNLLLLLFLVYKNHYSLVSLTSLISFITLIIICIDKLAITVFLCCVSVILGYIIFPGILPVKVNAIFTWHIFGILVIFCQYIILTKKNVKKTIYSRIDSMNNLLNLFANEARTPLRTIASYSFAMQNYFPKLLEAYKIAEENGLAKSRIYPVHLSILSESIAGVSSEIQNLFLMLDMVLMNLTYNPDEEFTQCSAIEEIKQAIEMYNIPQKYKSLIHVNESKDFKFYGSKTLFLHVIYNLLNNAFYQIKSINRGEININIQNDKKNNVILFTDTSTGIPYDVMPYIFDEFFSTNNMKMGLGLSFCKSTMKKFRGNIVCESENGKYTTFKLFFPKLLEKSSKFVNDIVV